MRKSENVDRAARALLAMQRYSWEQGVAMQAFFEMGEKALVIAMSHEAVYRSMEDGRAATIGLTNAVTDPCSVGEALLAACGWTGDPFLMAGKEALLDWALSKAPRNAWGVIYHLTDSRQFWVDSFYMLPPFLLAAGHPEEALVNYYGYYEALHDAETGLMAHMWDDENGRFARAAHWGTGNGWMLAASARMIPMLRQQHRRQDAERMAGLATALLDRLRPLMRADGLFHDVVDAPDTFAETNLSQMLAYTVYRGCSDGWLDDDYLPWAHIMRRAANAKLNPYGFVAGVCGAPGFDKPGFSPEGQAFYLLMETAAVAGGHLL